MDQTSVLIMVFVLIISLVIAVWVNAKVCGEPDAKKLLCRLGFHNLIFVENDHWGKLKCVDCPHEEIVNPYE